MVFTLDSSFVNKIDLMCFSPTTEDFKTSFFLTKLGFGISEPNGDNLSIFS